jgi:UDP-N-acetylglucosamine 2-epimerase (non-hydrolysing)
MAKPRILPPRVLCLVGTRPEAIKMAPVVRALIARGDLAVQLVLTGQHPDLAAAALAGFGLVAERDLAVMQPGPGRDRGLNACLARLLLALDPLLAEAPPALVLAQGDTTTVMAAALACFHRGIPFAHVEAGLRTGDLQNPFPEEFYRQTATRLACLHFAPTGGARDALLREGVPADAIHVTGNTVVDALLETAAALPPAPPPAWPRLLLTLHRRESFGAPAARVFRAVQALCARLPELEVIYPVHPNPAVRRPAEAAFAGHAQVRLLPPLDYPELVAALRGARLVLTDSGGLQEEAPALGVPVLVLRSRTERPEAVAMGAARLVGTDTARILAEATRLLRDPAAHAAMARGASPYGDGRAGARIAAIVAAHLGLGGRKALSYYGGARVG